MSRIMLLDDAPGRKLAGEAHLSYVSDAAPGFTRVRKGNRLLYVDEVGRPVLDPRHLARIERLVIPPAWTDVWICKTERGHLQCTGRDSRGRKQYLYHPRWRKAANDAKFANLLGFGESLSRIRRRVARDLRAAEWTKDKLAAAAVRLLDRSAIRIGNQEYARDNASYGLTTLEAQHVKVRGCMIQLNFIGKSGKEHALTIHDRTLAPIVKALLNSGRDTLLSMEIDGVAMSLTSTDVNAYLQRISANTVTAKDFRTWAASVMVLESLCSCNDSEPCRRHIIKALKAAASTLGNTVTVCQRYYVFPGVLELFETNKLARMLDKFTPVPRAHSKVAEQRLLWILRACSRQMHREPQRRRAG